MADFKSFMKENQKKKEHVFYAATKSLCDENGKPLEWEFRQITFRRIIQLRCQSQGSRACIGRRPTLRRSIRQ